MTYVYVELDFHEVYLQEPNEEDPWDIGETKAEIDWLGLTVGDWTQDSCRTRTKVVSPDVIEPGDCVYAVVLRYTTGCTFGFQTWLPEVLNVFKNEEDAVGLCEVVDKGCKEGAYNVSYKNTTYYTGAWTGYFESIDDIEIREVVVR